MTPKQEQKFQELKAEHNGKVLFFKENGGYLLFNSDAVQYSRFKEFYGNNDSVKSIWGTKEDFWSFQDKLCARKEYYYVYDITELDK